MKSVTTIFEFIAEGVNYQTKATRFTNGAAEECYRVSVNGSPVMTFVLDDKNEHYVVQQDKRNPSIPAAALIIIGQQLSRNQHSVAA